MTDAAYISWLPMVMGGGIRPVDVSEHVAQRNAAHTASLRFVTPGFFQAMRIPLRTAATCRTVTPPTGLLSRW